MAVGRALKSLYLSGRAELDLLERWRPLCPPADEGKLAFEPDRHLACRWAQYLRWRSFFGEKPGRAYQGVAGEGQLRPRREDAKLTQFPVLDEDRLGEAQVRSDVLALFV